MLPLAPKAEVGSECEDSAYVEDDRVALEEARAANADIVPADEQTRQALSGLLATMRATLMERANKLDIAGAEEALDGFQASVDKWSAIVAKAKSDDEIAAALMSEVYSKM